MKRMDFMKDSEREGEDFVFVGNGHKKKLDLVPKIICFFIALFIWIYMMNLNVTDVTATVTLKISVEGENELQQGKNMMIYGIDKDTVTVTVKGSNRDLRKYTEADYSAVVNVKDINECGRASLPIEVRVPSGSSITVMNKEQYTVNLYADNSMTKNVPINIVKGDIITVSTYEYNYWQSHETVEVTGPKSVVDHIASSKYQIDGEFYSSKSYSGFALQFYDANDNPISVDSGILTYSTNDMTISVNVSHSKPVPVKIKVTGEGSELIPMMENPNVIIKGDPMVLAGVTEYTLVLEKAEAGQTISASLMEDLLPEGVTFAEERTLTITFVLPEQGQTE